MYNYFIIRLTNRTDGTFGSLVHAFTDEAEALKDYFRECGKAVDSTHFTDSISMLSKEGFEIRHECFTHEAQAEEEPTEPIEE